VPERGLVSTYVALTLNADLQPIHRIPLSGAPTRARVSPDGRYGAATVFVFGHSYADANFSTQTTMIDMSSGTSLGDLEEYATTRDGATWASEDFNFWGVTFAQADSDVFYATVRSAGKTYLVEGDVEARTMRVLRENVECPSFAKARQDPAVASSAAASSGGRADVPLRWPGEGRQGSRFLGTLLRGAGYRLAADPWAAGQLLRVDRRCLPVAGSRNAHPGGAVRLRDDRGHRGRQAAGRGPGRQRRGRRCGGPPGNAAGPGRDLARVPRCGSMVSRRRLGSAA
jgi:hypothetical protein